MDSESLHDLAGSSPLRSRHAPYHYCRRTARCQGGRPVYIFYFALWDPRARAYGAGRSTGQTNRAAAERWLALYLAQEQESSLSLRAFAGGMEDIQASANRILLELSKGNAA